MPQILACGLVTTKSPIGRADRKRTPPVVTPLPLRCLRRVSYTPPQLMESDGGQTDIDSHIAFLSPGSKSIEVEASSSSNFGHKATPVRDLGPCHPSVTGAEITLEDHFRAQLQNSRRPKGGDLAER